MNREHARPRGRPWLAWVLAVALASSLIAPVPAHAAGGRTYTLDADFDEGVMVGLNHDAPNQDQLQLNMGSSTFPFIWIANSGEGTISKLDTITGKELGRYRTAPQGHPSNPSRTTVDLDGNVWVGNRDSNTVTKVGLKEAGNCVDRNGNGTIETSVGIDPVTLAPDVRPWAAASGPSDECILLHVKFPTNQGNNVRMVAIDANNNVYAGGSYTGWFHYIDGQTGAILGSYMNPVGINNGGWINYGGVVDADGHLWISTLWNNRLVRFRPADGSFQVIVLPHTSYGLGIDKFGHIWVAGYNYGRVSKVLRNTGAIVGTYPVPGGCYSRGLAVEDNGDVWVANTCSDTAGHLGNDGSNKGTVKVGNGPTGVAVDAAGKVWVTNLYSHNATRIDPATNATATFKVGNSPYNYSDMTGHIVRNITTNRGTWTVVYDSGAAGTAWGTLSWNGTTPADTSISGRVRAADTQAGLGSRAYVGVGNGVGFSGITGRYIQIEMTLQTSVDGVTPALHDVTIEPEVQCDPDPTLTWKAPLNPSSPYALPTNGHLPIAFSWGTCAGFIHDESVVIMVQDPANPDYPVTAWVYEWDIVIDDAAGEYRQDFYPEQYWLAAGTTLEIEVYIGDQFIGEALVHLVSP